MIEWKITVYNTKREQKQKTKKNNKNPVKEMKKQIKAQSIRDVQNINKWKNDNKKQHQQDKYRSGSSSCFYRKCTSDISFLHQFIILWIIVKGIIFRHWRMRWVLEKSLLTNFIFLVQKIWGKTSFKKMYSWNISSRKLQEKKNKKKKTQLKQTKINCVLGNMFNNRLGNLLWSKRNDLTSN